MLCAQIGRRSFATHTRSYAVRATVKNVAAAPLRDGTLRYGFNKEDIAEQQDAKARDFLATNVAFYPQTWATYRNYSKKAGKPLDPKLNHIDDLIVENRYQILLDLLTPEQLDEHLKENDNALRPIREKFDKKVADGVLASF